MPFAITYAHKLAKKLTEVRKSGEIKDIGPDGKTQITVEYDDDKVKRIDAIVVSTQHKDTKDVYELRKEIKEKVIDKVIPSWLLDENTKYFIKIHISCGSGYFSVRNRIFRRNVAIHSQL